MVVLLGLTLAGIPYYAADLATRVRSPLHVWLKPSGYIGQSLGVLALLGFLSLWLYPIRKKFPRLAFAGSVPRWLEVHIVIGLTMPLAAAIHAGWRFTGLIGLGYLSLFLVALSGVIGRYIYVHIPRSRNGMALGVEEIAARRREMLVQMAGELGMEVELVQSALSSDPPPIHTSNPLRVLVQMVRDDWSRRRAVRDLRSRWIQAGHDPSKLDPATLKRLRVLARQQLGMAQQLRLLTGTQQVFRYWHVAHRPFAITAFLALAIHVAVAVVFGATWFY